MPRYHSVSAKILILLLFGLLSSSNMAESLFAPKSSIAKPFSSEPQFLAADQAFKLIASGDDKQLLLSWQIEEGYYLYQHRTTLTRAQQNQPTITLAFPEGKAMYDEYFGDITAYYGSLELVVPLDNDPGNTDKSQVLKLVYQGCADAGLCYPPQKRTVTIEHNGHVLLSKTN